MASSPASIADAASELLAAPAEFVGTLSGGAHAQTAVIRVNDTELVVRRFPTGDDAVQLEVPVLARIRALGTSVPQLIAYRADQDPLIVTTKVEGVPPDPALDPVQIATEMARVLARLHELDPTGMPSPSRRLPESTSPIAQAARRYLPNSDPALHVLTHGDFWCGNALWVGERLTGVVDWSSAHVAPRGFDVAWCRQDLVLLGSPDAATVFVDSYEKASGAKVVDLHAWDLNVGARAEPVVETWALNYLGIGRPEITAEVLRERLDDWNASLLRPR